MQIIVFPNFNLLYAIQARIQTGPRLRLDADYEKLKQHLLREISLKLLPDDLKKVMRRYRLTTRRDGAILYEKRIWPRRSEAERIVKGYLKQSMGIHALYKEVNEHYCIPRDICSKVLEVCLTVCIPTMLIYYAYELYFLGHSLYMYLYNLSLSGRRQFMVAPTCNCSCLAINKRLVWRKSICTTILCSLYAKKMIEL